jgi:hypothetical protein
MSKLALILFLSIIPGIFMGLYFSRRTGCGCGSIFYSGDMSINIHKCDKHKIIPGNVLVYNIFSFISDNLVESLKDQTRPSHKFYKLFYEAYNWEKEVKIIQGPVMKENCVFLSFVE